MLSAGNDIVALSEINIARTNTKQFYSKILSASELTLYQQLSATISFENYVWLLWSIKESAFKFLKRLHPELLFTPVKFVVQQLEIPVGYSPVIFGRQENPNPIISLIKFGNYQLYSRSKVYKELIFSVVDSNEDFGGVFSDVKYIDSTGKAIQSAEVRTFLIDELSKLTGRSGLNIQKNAAEIPVVYQDLEKLPIPVSISHHENYIGYSFKLQQ